MNESLHLAEGSEDLSFNLQNDGIESQLADDENRFKKSDEESLNEEKEHTVIRKAKSSPFKNC